MSNVSKIIGFKPLRVGTAVFAAIVCLSGVSLAQTAPAYSDVPDPSVAPLAAPVADTPESYVGEGVSSGAALSPSEVIRLLQDGNAGKPLTIAQLAAINDAMKRMEYAAEMRRKMGDAGSGSSASFSTGSASTSAPVSGGAVQPAVSSMSSGIPTVLRISGSSGNYQALVSNGQQQFVIREGDSIGNAKVTSIRISGVRLTSDSGSISTLPFSNPFGVGVTSSSR